MIDNSSRLDLVERLYLELADPSGVVIHARLAKRQPQKGCHCGKRRKCDHGPPLLANPNGEPYALHTVQGWVKEVKERLRGRLAADREDNRALAVARFDLAFSMAAQQESPRDAIQAAARRAELDGSHVAAEDAGRLTLYQRVRLLMVAVEDYDPPGAPRTPSVPLPPETARYQLERLERLLLAADESSARFRARGDPTGMTEGERLTWRRNALDEAILQTVTSPTATADKKRDVVIRAAGTASMITEGADLVERQAALKSKIDK